MAVRIGASLGIVALVTAIYVSVVPVNPTTIAVSYLVIILLIATQWGIAESTVASVAAVLCFNFFFLPPVRTFTIADPQNWVALVAFLLTAIIASQVSGRARQRNIDALARQRDLERLYALSRSLLLSESSTALPAAIARHIAEAFELDAVGVYDQRTATVSWAGKSDVHVPDDRLREVARRGITTQDSSGLTTVAIQLGGVATGSVAITAAGLSDTVLRSIANLAAIGLERSRGEAATAQAEAARQSSEVRATVLDALAHEFKTPLTSLKAATGDLIHRAASGSRDHELLEIVDEELDRLQALVTDAVQMLRIDAGDFAVHVERHHLAEVVARTLQNFERRLDGRRIVQHIPLDLTVEADRALLSLALRQLLDNAVKYSPQTSTIEIEGRSNGAVEITVRNSGSAISEHEQPRLAERFFRGARARNIPGTGMGLAIVQQIAQSHGGTLTFTSSPDRGTAFTITLPHGGHR